MTNATVPVGPSGLSASVIVATMDRPEHLRQCLHHLSHQTFAANETLVVDASSNDLSARLVEREFPGVRYVRNDAGPGTLPESRDIGLRIVTGDVVAFLDDDANARPDWLAQLVARFSDPAVGGVGGRASNNVPGEENYGLGSIGVLLPDGRLIGNFGADPGRDLVVDHLLGANMSYRRDLLLRLGGVHGRYPGTCLREDSDIALRVTAAGYKLIFTPDAVVEHVPGPYVKGKRFDRRYTYYAQRNHIVLLARTKGYRDVMFRRFLVTAARDAGAELRRSLRAPAVLRSDGPVAALRSLVGGLTRALSILAGLAAGFPASVSARRFDRGVATRTGPTVLKIAS